MFRIMATAKLFLATCTLAAWDACSDEMSSFFLANTKVIEKRSTP
jgi:hypothetical protein